MLEWRNITPSNHAKYMVKGTRLEIAIVPNTLSRFAVVSVRCYDKDGYSDAYYTLCDAYTVSDEQVRHGEQPKQVFWSHDLDAVLAKAKELSDN